MFLKLAALFISALIVHNILLGICIIQTNRLKSINLLILMI